MDKQWKRREILKQMAVASTAMLLPNERVSANTAPQVAGRDCEIQIASGSEHTLRVSVLPMDRGAVAEVPGNGSLVKGSWGPAIAKLRGEVRVQTVKCGGLNVRISPDPLAFSITSAKGEAVQQLSIDQAGAVSFAAGDSPLLGLGEGGKQFDRRG